MHFFWKQNKNQDILIYFVQFQYSTYSSDM